MSRVTALLAAGTLLWGCGAQPSKPEAGALGNEVNLYLFGKLGSSSGASPWTITSVSISELNPAAQCAGLREVTPYQGGDGPWYRLPVPDFSKEYVLRVVLSNNAPGPAEKLLHRAALISFAQTAMCARCNRLSLVLDEDLLLPDFRGTAEYPFGVTGPSAAKECQGVEQAGCGALRVRFEWPSPFACPAAPAASASGPVVAPPAASGPAEDATTTPPGSAP